MTTDIPGAAFRIHDLAFRQLPQRADHPALVEQERCLTYGQLREAAQSLASFFKDAGLTPGDRLLIIGENSIEQVVALLACSMLDAWSVLVNARLTAAEVAHIEAHCAPRLVFCTSVTSDDARTHARSRNASTYRFSGLVFECSSTNTFVEAEPVFGDSAEQVAVLIYTTGTTGLPKGVMLTHRNLGFSATASAAARHTCHNDDVYAVLPMSHVFGLTSVVLAGLSAGAKLRIVPRFDTDHLVEAIADGITFFQGVPAMYVRLLARHDKGTKLDAPRLRFLHCGGAPLDPLLKDRVEAILGLPVNNGYGMTEASPSICMVPFNQPRNDLTVGFLVSGLESRIVDEAGTDVPNSQVGELLVKGPNIMKGYYRAPELTAEVLSPDGWLRTQDLVCRNDEGAYFVMGRIKELIIRSGFNVYPSEVEAALNSYPDVAQSCVVGKLVNGDEQIIAFIEAKQATNIEPAALFEFISQRLAPYKRPQRIVVVDKLPAAQSGKILKKVVRDMAVQL